MIKETHHKKAFFLLLSTIFYFHDMEEHENDMIKKLAQQMKAEKEAEWACNFVKKDILNAFSRVKTEVENLLGHESDTVRNNILSKVWETTKTKGYITETEANLLLGLARKWGVEKDLIQFVKSS